MVKLDDSNDDNRKKSNSPQNLMLRSSTKTIETKNIYTEIRNKFQESLGRLNKKEVKEIAFKECEDIIKKFAQPEYLKIYVGLLSVCFLSSPPYAAELQVCLIGFLANTFKDKVDIDGMGLKRSIDRLLTIVRQFFSFPDQRVHKACSFAYSEIFNHCFSSLIELTQETIFAPLFHILGTGTSKNNHLAASLVIFDILKLANSETITKENFPNLIVVLRKLTKDGKNDFPPIFEALAFSAVSLNLSEIEQYKDILFDKSYIIFENFSVFDPITKSALLDLLETIGKKMIEESEYIGKMYQKDTLYGLQNIKAEKSEDIRKKLKKVTKVFEKINSEFDKLRKIGLEEEVAEQAANQSKLNMLRTLSKTRKLKDITEKSNENNVYDKGIGGLIKHSYILSSKKRSTNVVNHPANYNVRSSNFLKTIRNKSQASKIELPAIKQEDNFKFVEEDQEIGDQLINEEIKDSKPLIRKEKKSKLSIEKVSRFAVMGRRKALRQIVREGFDIKGNPKSVVIPKGSGKEMAKNIEKLFKEKEEKLLNDSFIKIERKLKEMEVKLAISLSKLEKLKFDGGLRNEMKGYQEEIKELRQNTREPSVRQKESNIYKVREFTTQTTIKRPQTVKVNFDNIIDYADQFTFFSDTNRIVSQKALFSNHLEEIKEKLYSYAEEKTSSHSSVWSKCYDLHLKHQHDEAFRMVLDSQDDLYFLRLLFLQRADLSALSVDTIVNLTKKLSRIGVSHSITALILQVVEFTLETSVFNILEFEEKNSILEILNNSLALDGEVGVKARTLYELITMN